MQEFADFFKLMWTNDPLICIIGAVILSMLIQAGISAVVLNNRREILKEDYGYNDGQIALFYWKSVLLFPLTWLLMIKQGISKLIRMVRR
jgi:hypothetical protein